MLGVSILKDFHELLGQSSAVLTKPMEEFTSCGPAFFVS